MKLNKEIQKILKVFKNNIIVLRHKIYNHNNNKKIFFF